MSARRPTGITRQDVEALARVRAWLATQPETALECDILGDIAERVASHARNAAIVRVRIKNAGTPPSERARRAMQAGGRSAGARSGPLQRDETTRCLPGTLWGADEKRLRTLFAEGLMDEEIAERLGRTPEAVEAKRWSLGLRRARAPHVITADEARQGIWGNPDARGRKETPLQRARRVMEERRRREADARRSA